MKKLLHLAAFILPVVFVTGLPAADESGWLIRFQEPGLYQDRADTRAFAAQRDALIARQAEHSRMMSQLLGRNPEITHHYLITHSGMAARLTAAEADRLRTMPGVVAVEPDRVEQIATYRSTAFIGADTVWSGDTTPGGLPSRGENMVVAIIDTGIDPDHPAFADDPECGHGQGTTSPKLLSYVDCLSTDEAGVCNGADATDTIGHGTHVAATAAGNRIESDQGTVSGVAPCAHIRAYKACPGQSCPFSAIQSSLENVLLDGDIDVMNFSIGGGTDPWVDMDRIKLDLVDAGIFVAASAGNTQPMPGMDNPVGRVNHLGPWVTTVAASSHDVWADGLLTAAGPGQPVPALESVQIFKGTDSPNLSDQSALPIRHFDQQPADHEGCTPGEYGAPSDLPAFPAGFFSGAAALIRAGNCPYTMQIGNAFDAGAQLVLIRAYPSISAIDLDTAGQPDVPAYGIGATSGDALAEFIAAHPDQAAIDLMAIQGDALAEFSLRGPTPAMFRGLTKPDVTAPGVRIYAPFTNSTGFDSLDGTSMASPHVAGAAALVRSLRPDWSVAEVGAALMMTARAEGLDDAWDRPWDWDGVGNGRIDLAAVTRAGLLMDEHTPRFLAADPRGDGFDLRDLNRPTLRDVDCSPHCAWTRTLHTTLDGTSEWIVTTIADTPGLVIDAYPARFTVYGGPSATDDPIFADAFIAADADPGATQTLAVTAKPPPGTAGDPAYGRVILTEVDGRSPPLHLTVTVSGQTHGVTVPSTQVSPRQVLTAGSAGGAHVATTVAIVNHGTDTLHWNRTDTPTPGSVWSQSPDADGGILSSHSSTQSGGLYTANDFNLVDRTLLTTVYTPGTDHGGLLAEQASITWAIYPDQGGQPAGNPETQAGAALWTWTATPDAPGVSLDGGDLHLDLETAGQTVDLDAGQYWLTVFPSYANSITGSGPRWTWARAGQAGAGARLISPGLYNVNTWAPITTFGVDFTDTAFTLEGRVGGNIDCAAPWLVSAPDTGALSAGEITLIEVELDPSGLPPGQHLAYLCFDSDDPQAPTTIVPILLELGVYDTRHPESRASASALAR